MRQRALRFMLIAAVLLLESACGGGGGAGSPPPPAQPGSLQFETGSFIVDEDGGTASITITRTDGSDGTVSVLVTSSDGSAIAGTDYTAVSSPVSFAPGDVNTKTVTVTIADDGMAEPDETLGLVLSTPTGGARLGASTTTLTIRDDDLLPQPVLQVEADIKQLTFSWQSVQGASSYRLLQDADGASGFMPVGADLAADATDTTLEIAVHLHDWINARYQLEACGAGGCSASDPISAVDVMLQAIGYVKASNTGEGDNFGFSVALSADGKTLTVGAPDEDSGATGTEGGDVAQADNSVEEAGAVYVFTREGTAWSQQAYVKAANVGENDEFGSSVALSADGATLAVGAPFESSDATGVNGDPDNNDAPNAGAAYVFRRIATNAPIRWLQQAYVKASNTETNDFFGHSVSLNADGVVLAVGAPGEDSGVAGVQGDNSKSGSGAAYILTLAGMLWSQTGYLKASEPGASEKFGAALVLSANGTTLAVAGAGELDDQTNLGGTVHVLTFDEEQWTPQALLRATNSEAGDGFGAHLALSADGDTLAIGARNEDSGSVGVNSDQSNNDAFEAGAVYLFVRDTGAQTWSQQAYVKAPNAEEFDDFSSVALSADGGTLVVGAPGEASLATGVGGDQSDNSAEGAGALYVF